MRSESYRYGFNGQEKADEIKASGNSYTAEFWEYDPRLGRRWNLDPKPTAGLSRYSVFGLNPILNFDLYGDSLSVSMDANTKRDITNSVSSKFRDFIEFDIESGRVKLKESIMQGDKEIFLRSAVASDAGIATLNLLINSKDNFFYSTSNLRNFSDGINDYKNVDVSKLYPSGTAVEGGVTPGPSGQSGTYAYYNTFINLSKTERGDGIVQLPTKTQKFSSFTRKYDGVVTISPGTYTRQKIVNGQTIVENISSRVLLHELVENYFRTSMNMCYPEAHKSSIDYLAPYFTPILSSPPQRDRASGAQSSRLFNDKYFFTFQ